VIRDRSKIKNITITAKLHRYFCLKAKPLQHYCKSEAVNRMAGGWTVLVVIAGQVSYLATGQLSYLATGQVNYPPSGSGYQPAAALTASEPEFGIAPNLTRVQEGHNNRYLPCST
jgi:hypothetical protein